MINLGFFLSFFCKSGPSLSSTFTVLRSSSSRPKVSLRNGIYGAGFYQPDALPVTQPKEVTDADD